jgi:wyosine [tRNA(Phe)-imidazoG37] synthetase (radical SAM superfamily)
MQANKNKQCNFCGIGKFNMAGEEITEYAKLIITLEQQEIEVRY